MAAGPVAVAGEALIDLVQQPGGSFLPLPGGGPFNTARAVARLGQATAFVGAISRDSFGRRLSEALSADGVQLDQRLLTEHPTSLALAELDEAGSASYRFYFAGTSAPALEPQLAAAALPPSIAALHVGSLGLVLQPLADAVEALVEQAPRTALRMVDPNVRPAVLGDVAGWRARLDRILARADIVKVSHEDLQVLAPGRSPEAAAEALLDKGPRLVLLTLGAGGAITIGRSGRAAAQAPRVAVIDSIGAGDIFSGAWLARWLQLGRPVDDLEAAAAATAFACRAAAWSCARAGAVAPTLAELGGWAPASAT
jgi:fructokinase